MLRECVLDYKEQWDDCLPLCEFAYNDNFHSSIGMVPLGAFFGHSCRTPIGWEEVRIRSFRGSSIVGDISEKVKKIQEHLKATRSRQKSMLTGIVESFSFELGAECFCMWHQFKELQYLVRRASCLADTLDHLKWRARSMMSCSYCLYRQSNPGFMMFSMCLCWRNISPALSTSFNMNP